MKKSPIQREEFGPTKTDWSEELVALLGELSDVDLAKRMSVHPATVAEERRRRGIAPFKARRPNIEWTDEMIALLGEATDREVAAELEVSVPSVTYRRSVLRIPAFGGRGGRRESEFWTLERIALLGTRSDNQLARLWNLSPTSISYRRHVLGIPHYRPPRPDIQWNEEMHGWLGRETDTAVAKRLGISADAVARERKRLGIPPASGTRNKIVRAPELRPFLERRTEDVAAELGIAVATVRGLRADLGVPPATQGAHWTPEMLAKLGRVPDDVIAEEMGLKNSTVGAKRRKQGIRPPQAPRWTPEEDRLVESLPPAEAAERTGRTRRAVYYRRRHLGVVPQQSWTEEKVALLGTMNDHALARRLGLTPPAVRV